MKHTLSDLSSEYIVLQSQRIQQLILGTPQYTKAQRISIYLSMPEGEVQTDKIVQHALSNGKRVFVPYLYSPATKERGTAGMENTTSPKQNVTSRKVMDMMTLESQAEFESLKPDAWGIPSLAAGCIERRENAQGGYGVSRAEDGEKEGARLCSGGLDLVIVPGVAFDADMCRLGHGAGFYDEFLTRLCCSSSGRCKPPFLLALCLAEQFLPSGRIPVTESDWKVDAVAVGDGRLVTSRA